MFNKTIDYDFIALPKVHKILTGNELKLFITLFDEWNMMQNKNGWFFRSQKDLVEDSGLSLRTVQRTLASLIEKGVILATSYNDGAKLATYNKANEYKIVMDKVFELSEKGVKLTCKRVSNWHQEGCQIDVPTKNKKTKNKENNNYLSTIDMKDLGPKVTEVKKENNIKEKVNEMKNAVLNEMEREVKNNKNITSTAGTKNTNSNLKIDNNSDANNSVALVDDDLFNEIFGISSTGTVYKAAGDVKTPLMEQLPTNGDKNAPEGFKTQNNAYSLQVWMTEYQKLILQVENTDVEDTKFDTILEDGVTLIENFPKTEGNYKRAMQDLRYWVAKKIDFLKSIKVSNKWNKYYRTA